MLEQHGEKLDGELGGKPKPRVEVMCVNGHTFAPTKDDIKTTESGKSPIAFCPVCGGVARVTKANLGKLFAFKRNDTRAFHATVKSIRNAQLNVAAAVNAGPVATPAAGQGGAAPDLSRGDPGSVIQVTRDPEFTAQREVVDGPEGKVTRYRVRQPEDEDDEDDDGDDEEYDDEEGDEEDDEEEVDEPRKPRRRRSLTVRKPSQADLDALDDQAELERERADREERVRRGKELITARRARMPVVEDEAEFDPNQTLKEIVAESGLDEYTLERVYDYIDMQPDGWQPAAIQGILQMYIAPQAAQRLASRYQAEIYKETKRRDREQQALSLIGNPAGNLRMPGGGTRNSPPFGYPPLGQGNQPGAAMFAQPSGSPPYPLGVPGAPNQVPQDPRFRFDPNEIFRTQRRKDGMSPDEVKNYVDAVLTREREAQMVQQREDSMRREIESLRTQMVQMIQTSAQKPQTSSPMDEVQKQYVAGLQAQVNMLMQYLLQAAQQGGKVDLTGLQNEIRDLKKSAEQSVTGLGGIGGSTGLRDLVELQKLSNDINVAKLEFQESLQSKQFTKDLVEGALQQIGQTIASVYTAKGTGMPIGAPVPPARAQPLSPPSMAVPPTPSPPAPVPAPQKAETVVEEVSPKTYSVKAQAKGGKMDIPCPVAGCDGVISASPGDMRVVCPKNASHVFTLEPPQDVVDAIRKKEAPPHPTVQEEKPIEQLVESVLAGGGSVSDKPVVPPTEAHKKTYGGVL
jgi:hypothetical protein